MRKTLLVTAICLSFGLAAPAFAQDTSSGHSHQNNNNSTGDDRNNAGDAYADGAGSASANNGGTSTSALSSSFNTSKAVAISRLEGSVSDVSVSGIGNAEIGRAHV